MCMHPLDASTSFLGLFAFSGLDLGFLLGKFSFIQPFQGILMHSGLYVGILESFAALHMRVYASNMSV